MQTDVWLAADAAVTEDERRAFLDRFPRLRGAYVADVLDILDNHDEYLDVLEPMHEEHGADVPNKRVLTAATLLCAGIHGADAVTWGRVRELAERIGAQMGDQS
jgi:hypothetical protein